MSIQISDEQRQALQDHVDVPVEVVDPQTQRAYVLLPLEEYERMQLGPVAGEQVSQRGRAITARIPPGIRRSQEAYWQDLPELLPKASRTRRWVAYHGGERIGFGRTETELYQECYRRGLKDDEFYIGRVRPSEVAPWEPDFLEPLIDTGEGETYDQDP